jgi:hypothetical protein
MAVTYTLEYDYALGSNAAITDNTVTLLSWMRNAIKYGYTNMKVNGQVIDQEERDAVMA